MTKAPELGWFAEKEIIFDPENYGEFVRSIGLDNPHYCDLSISEYVPFFGIYNSLIMDARSVLKDYLTKVCGISWSDCRTLEQRLAIYENLPRVDESLNISCTVTQLVTQGDSDLIIELYWQVDKPDRDPIAAFHDRLIIIGGQSGVDENTELGNYDNFDVLDSNVFKEVSNSETSHKQVDFSGWDTKSFFQFDPCPTCSYHHKVSDQDSTVSELGVLTRTLAALDKILSESENIDANSLVEVSIVDTIIWIAPVYMDRSYTVSVIKTGDSELIVVLLENSPEETGKTIRPVLRFNVDFQKNFSSRWSSK